MINFNNKRYSKSGFLKLNIEKLSKDETWLKNYDSITLDNIIKRFGKNLHVLKHFLCYKYNNDEKYAFYKEKIYSKKGWSVKKFGIDGLISNIEKSLLEYITDNYNVKDVKEIYKYLYFNNILTLEFFFKNYTGEYGIKIFSNKNFVHPKKYADKLKGAHFKGVKRPNHSIIMKQKMKIAANNRTLEHKANLKNHLQSLNFKKQRLITLGIIEKNSILKDDEIYDKYIKWNSEYRKSDIHKKNKILNFLNSEKYENIIPYKKYKKKYTNVNLDENNIQKIYKELVSIISTYSCTLLNNNMGSPIFKRGIIKNIKYNMSNNTEIKYKSSYEEKSINFFEENLIKWDYEKIILNGPNYLYVPDFFIIMDGKKYILEVKGFIRDSIHLKKIKRNLKLCLKYCISNDILLCYIKKPILKKEDITSNIINNTQQIKEIL